MFQHNSWAATIIKLLESDSDAECGMLCTVCLPLTSGRRCGPVSDCNMHICFTETWHCTAKSPVIQTGSVQINVILQYYLMDPQQTLCWQLTKTHTKLCLRGQRTYHKQGIKNTAGNQQTTGVSLYVSTAECQVSQVTLYWVDGPYAATVGAAAVGQHIHY